MIVRILTSKIVTSIAYTIIGSEVVKSTITIGNARKVAGALGSAAHTTGKVIGRRASDLKRAVNQRRAELVAAKLDEDDIPY